ncbi:helix-turn-helix domain-containing protein [Streptomyces noursei]|uniref:helix-turn-helix domain-containing protein n=1 Tax=Streptomyces noursei TaxID=1971 RepID=UPI003800D664
MNRDAVPRAGTDMATALLAMFAQLERIYMLERAAGARAAEQAPGLPTGRPAKLNATARAGAAQRIKDGAPEQVAAELGISRSTLYRELRKHHGRVAVRVAPGRRSGRTRGSIGSSEPAWAGWRRWAVLGRSYADP